MKKLPLWEQRLDPDAKFFLTQIREYNKNHDHDSHLVKIDDERAMLIFRGNHGWEYRVYPLEAPVAGK